MSKSRNLGTLRKHLWSCPLTSVSKLLRKDPHIRAIGPSGRIRDMDIFHGRIERLSFGKGQAGGVGRVIFQLWVYLQEFAAAPGPKSREWRCTSGTA